MTRVDHGPGEEADLAKVKSRGPQHRKSALPRFITRHWLCRPLPIPPLDFHPLRFGMRLYRLFDIIGIAVLEFAGIEGFVGKATNLGAMFNAACLRELGQVVHFTLEIRERCARGLDI